MNRIGFNPEDIENTQSRFGRGHKKSTQPATAGIPSVVPREPVLQNNVNAPKNDVVWAIAADRAEQQQAQELPPVIPCFSQADIDEFLARKPQKYRMTERDFQELGRNMVLGLGDLIISTTKAVIYTSTLIPASKSQKYDDDILYYTTGDDGERQAWGENGRIF